MSTRVRRDLTRRIARALTTVFILAVVLGAMAVVGGIETSPLP